MQILLEGGSYESAYTSCGPQEGITIFNVNILYRISKRGSPIFQSHPILDGQGREAPLQDSCILIPGS